MKIYLALLLFCSISEASTCGFATSQTLGWWKAANPSGERSNHTPDSCDSLYVGLTCEANGELKLAVLYRCNKYYDWFYSQERRFSVTNGRLDGEDGAITGTTFKWDSLIPNVSGTKIEMSITGLGMARIVIAEDPKYYNPEITFTGTMKKITESEVPHEAEPLAPDALNGKWSGTVTIRDFDKTGKIRKQVQCALADWNLQHTKGVLYQTHLYIPDCSGINVNLYVGGAFLRAGVAYESNGVTGAMEATGSYDVNHMTLRHLHYIVSEESYAFHDDQLTLKLLSKYTDMSTTPSDVWVEYTLDLKR
jgi:hypothetical protein